MTIKEAEHWLIDNDFCFVSDNHGGYWTREKEPRAAIVDSCVQEDPKGAIQRMKSYIE